MSWCANAAATTVLRFFVSFLVLLLQFGCFLGVPRLHDLTQELENSFEGVVRTCTF